MSGIITVRIDADLERSLDRATENTGRSRSDLIREALKRRLAVLEFEHLRSELMPLAEAKGYLTDEDVLRDIR